eukprot:632975-Lingulodinium_polyedra.AAC.1
MQRFGTGVGLAGAGTAQATGSREVGFSSARHDPGDVALRLAPTGVQRGSHLRKNAIGRGSHLKKNAARGSHLRKNAERG